MQLQVKSGGMMPLHRSGGYIVRYPPALRDDAPAQHRRLLVIGCPRTGSRFITYCFGRLAGLGVYHEAMGPGGSVTCFFAVDDYYYPGKHRGRRDQFSFEHVWHQVRHPLGTISSMVTLPAHFRHWQEKHTGILGDLEPKELFAARFWLAWSKLCEGQSEWTYRIEDFTAIWPEMLDRLGLDTAPAPEIRRNVGQSRQPRLSWDDIHDLDPELCESIQKKAIEYGYTM